MATQLDEPLLKPKLKIKKPSRYKVIMFNDDFTPFYFVEQVLSVIFNKSSEESKAITQEIHNKGSSVVGVFTLEIAQTKIKQTEFNARQNGFPLLCDLEEEQE